MILTHNQLALENSLRRILPAGVVSCWIPDGYNRAKDIIRGNHGQCYGTHPNVPVINMARPPNLLTDGGLNLWNDATHLTHWWSSGAGSSTINRESAEAHKVEGAYSCRLDVDADNSQAYIRSSPSLTPLKRYKLVIWYKNSVAGKTTQIRVNNLGANVYLQDNFTWGAGVNYITLPNSIIWKKVEIYFYAHADYSSYYLYLLSLSAASSSIYLDKLSIEEFKPSLIRPDIGWCLGGDDHVDCGNDKSLQVQNDDFSFGLWFNNQLTTAAGQIASKYTSVGGFQIRMEANGRLYFKLAYNDLTKNEDTFGSVGDYNDSAWHFVDARYKKNDEKIYIHVDTSLIGELLTDKTKTVGEAGSLFIGQVVSQQYFKGYIALFFLVKGDWPQQQFNNIYLDTYSLFSPRG